MNLILIKPSEVLVNIVDDQRSRYVSLSKNDHRTIHIRKHLHKKSGDAVSVGILGERKGQASVQLNGDGSATLILLDTAFVQPPTVPEITVILAMPFPARLKALWPVMSSFHAVTRIIIVKGQLSDKEFCETSALQPKVYEPLIEKGMSQGVRTRPVQVDICVDECHVSKELLQRLGLLNDNASQPDDVARLFLDCGDETMIPPPAREVVLKHCTRNSTPKSIIAFGPERGWTDEEASTFVNESKFEAVSLGSSILRVDTAVIAGIGVVSAALDECQSRINDSESNKKRKKLS
ncbi:hypothetical protein HJC23_005158 [Cyclotella cryptica]|uniref:16S rRNA (uracil(1498)-N(3))-methyltransferase n=1 Tax=Cyclotella cryptica TaxID=29204 RepID=A0ABD3QGW1_9STRA|eukprot:CCRYP_005848-RA/>CCRYP_005848-RA protein AED:0.36 eAED:0.36 QI:0/-1/0/1/-1/1/1/0/292